MEPIVFDKASGISLEEQQEILAGLDMLKRPLERLEAGEAAASYEKQAKKKGVLLPALANGVAAAVLLLGFAALFLTHERDEARFMRGAAMPGVTERKLIAEIRRDFTERLEAKDAEIEDVLTKIAGIDAEMRNIQRRFDNKLILESEKDKALADLQRQKDEYQTRFAALQQERGQLLEDARIREAALRSQLSANKELSGQVQNIQAELASAQEALRSLTGEQEKNALIDRQIDGYFAAVNEQIGAALFGQAASTLSALRDFLDAPSFQTIKAFRERKPARLALVNTLSELILNSKRLAEIAPEPPAEAPPGGAPQGNGLGEQIEKYEETVAQLTARNRALEQMAADQERSGRDAVANAAALNNELSIRNQALQETAASREAALTELRNQNAALQQSLTMQENAASALRTQVSSLQQSLTAQENAASALRTQVSSLQQSLTAQENAASALRTQVSSLQQSLTAQENAASALRTQVSSLQQSVAEKDASINTLQTQNSELQQRVEQLQTQNDAIRQLLNN
jgi:myosin protein heavy chain